MMTGLPTFLLDLIVFNKIKAALGGNLKFAISGGAPLPKDTQEFLTVALCPIGQGYGLTETCGYRLFYHHEIDTPVRSMTCLQGLETWSPLRVGIPAP